MVTFLAQYGRRWVVDSQKALKVLKSKDRKKGLLMSYFLEHARIMTSTYLSDESREGHGDPQVANWSNTWSRVMMFREMQRSYALDLGVQMPFGFRSERMSDNLNRPFKLTFARYESKIKRLVENLPPGLFEIRRQDVQVIERICSSDLENFLLFLQCEPVVPVSTVKHKKHANGLKANMVNQTNSWERNRESGSQNQGVASNACETELRNSSTISAGYLCAERNGVRVEASSDVETTSECRPNVADSLKGVLDGDADTENVSWKSTENWQDHDEGTLWNGVAIRTGTELDIGRVLDLKLGFGHLPEIDAEELQRDAESPIRGIREWSQNCVVEFTVHLENLFAVGNEYNAIRHHDLESREEDKRVPWDAYLKELCIHSPVSSVLNVEGVSPCCLSQSYYWNTWNLPEMAPPALGDIGLEDYESDTKGLDS
ncbi:hypothetical protein FGB62_36g118 [Gracilaria domingensis]|nr:hypothetical protein FGB62_36g118 [Gracilaria domingensis]